MNYALSFTRLPILFSEGTEPWRLILGLWEIRWTMARMLRFALLQDNSGQFRLESDPTRLRKITLTR